jgi:hypothetical protein
MRVIVMRGRTACQVFRSVSEFNAVDEDLFYVELLLGNVNVHVITLTAVVDITFNRIFKHVATKNFIKIAC